MFLNGGALITRISRLYWVLVSCLDDVLVPPVALESTFTAFQTVTSPSQLQGQKFAGRPFFDLPPLPGCEDSYLVLGRQTSHGRNRTSDLPFMGALYRTELHEHSGNGWNRTTDLDLFRVQLYLLSYNFQNSGNKKARILSHATGSGCFPDPPDRARLRRLLLYFLRT